jgi:hypothetical protein
MPSATNGSRPHGAAGLESPVSGCSGKNLIDHTFYIKLCDDKMQARLRQMPASKRPEAADRQKRIVKSGSSK